MLFSVDSYGSLPMSKEIVTLTPMQTQVVVGLLCLRASPDAVDITVGNMVHDKGSESMRDVDVTVTSCDQGGVISAFAGFEVKDEGTSLDV